MQKPDNVIGIDPDTDKNGVAWLHTKTREFELCNLTLVELIPYLEAVKATCTENKETLAIVIESSWFNTHNHHLSEKDNRKTSSKIGYNVGRNHQRGIDIEEIMEHLHIDFVRQPPLRKTWKGKDGKITHPELAYFTGIKTRTNQEVRDAALIAWNYANLPIRVKFLS